MVIKLFNTLSREKETFKPLATGKVGMYNCGPTVYDQAHIGNLRSYVFADTLRRMFEYNGYQIKQIINITDVGHLTSDADEGEDKMTKALKRENKPLTLEAMKEVATKYFDIFVEDLKLLNVELPSVFPRASEHIEEDIELVAELERLGFTYTISGGVCFDISKFPSYGKLGNIKIDTLKEGARIAVDSEKRSPADFWLWKFDKNIGWDSPWGKGFPGWHIECSAMSKKYLGQPFDIHTGGIDHIPVHHNNEIAQSEAAYGKPLADYWMHNEFITINNGKMAKSTGNYITLQTLQNESISPIAFRYWLLTAHYRSPVDFSFEAVKAAQNAFIRLMAATAMYPDGGNANAGYQKRFLDAINDDMDMPKAVALAWELVKDTAVDPADKRTTLLDFDRVFGLGLAKTPRVGEEAVPMEVKALADAREEARKNKDWEKADALRAEIGARGFDVEDTAEGPRITAK